MHIIFPFYPTIRFAQSIVKKCQQARLTDDRQIIFDLSRCTFVSPFGVTLLAGAMWECAERGHQVEYVLPFAKKPLEFLQSVGFEKFGDASADATRFVGRQVGLRFLTGVDPSYSDEVLQVLRSYIKMSEGVKNALHLSINELMTNTFDHSQTVKGCFICAQAYTIRGNIDICITDFGRGILRALSSADRYANLSTSINAIEMAVQEGVSSRPGPAAGLGLTHIQRFLEVNKGKMHILSGDGWVQWDFSDNGRVRKKQISVAFDGTVVDIIAKADGEGFYFLSSEKPDETIF